jgi:D-amino-acid oxidase
MGAGGLWMPFHVEDDRVERWAKETLDELLRYSKNSKLVEIVAAVVLKRAKGEISSLSEFAEAYLETCELPEWTEDPRIDYQDICVQNLYWQNFRNKLRIPPEEELKEAGYRYASLFRPPIVDSPNMLEHLLSEVKEKASEVNVETNEFFQSVEQMQDRAVKLGCDTVVNCTGLGAASICKDDQLVGARGILLHFERSTCVRRKSVRDTRPYQFGHNFYDTAIMTEEMPWGTETAPCYMIPRGDVIVVGGSYLEDDMEPSIRDGERQRLLFNALRMGIDVDSSKVVGEWTGFRPFRTTVRCELENINDSVQVFHSYGYGGSGWTVYVGAAKECADTLLGISSDPTLLRRRFAASL